jgi:hypothetical protein
VALLPGAVPLRRFHELEPYWARLRAGERDVTWPGRIRLFAVTSGSTGQPKYVPVSEEGLRGFLLAGRDILSHYIVNTRDVAHFRGKFLYLGGSREPTPGPNGVVNGISAASSRSRPPWVYRPFRLPTPACIWAGLGSQADAVATRPGTRTCGG